MDNGTRVLTKQDTLQMEKLQIYHIHTSSDGTTGGDMASCLIPDVDQDVDSIPDYYEERVFLTNSSQQDSDADGLSDGDEVLVMAPIH